MRPFIFLAAVAVIATGCASDNAGPSPDHPLLAKGGKPGGPTDPTATWLIPLDDQDLAFRSDGQYGDGTYSVYADGVCGVGAKIFATTAYSNSGDATIGTTAPKGKNTCGRTFTVRYPDGGTETRYMFNNARLIQNTTTVIPVGETVKRTLAINPGDVSNSTPGRCGRLLFGVGQHGFGVGSDSVQVTRLDNRTWHVQSQEAPNNRAWCEYTGELYEMPVSFLIVAGEDLP